MSTSAVSSSSLYQQLQSYFQTRKSDVQQLGQALSSGSLADAQTAYNSLTALGQEGPFANGDAFHAASREQDLNAIGQALQSGDLAGAQQAFADLKAPLRSGGQTAPAAPTSTTSTPGGVLNLSSGSGPVAPTAGPLTSSSSEPEIIINLTNSANPAATAGGGPEIVINLSNNSTAATAANSSATSGTGPEIVLNLSNNNSSSPESIAINFSNSGNSGDEQVSLSLGNQQNPDEQQVTFNLGQNSNEQIILNLLNQSTSNSA